MHDSPSIEAECGVQPGFSKFVPLLFLVPPLCVLLFAWLLALTPDREEVGPWTVPIGFDPVQLNASGFAPLRLAGAWKLSSDDPEFGGISALAVEPGGLLALSDAGVLIGFPRPGDGEPRASMRQLPAGPGDLRFKEHRDSEALVADPIGRGWWVTFEMDHQLWLYDPAFKRPLQRVALPSRGWSSNSGVEALAARDRTLLLLPEPGRSVILLQGSRYRIVPLNGGPRRVSDAAALPDGTILLVERSLTPFGFANSLVRLEEGRRGYRRTQRIPLAVGPLDNVEALAVEALSDGTLRLWLMTDDNRQPPLRTLLIALDVPPA